jgi:hypothetical protein
MRRIICILLLLFALNTNAQNQVDFRGMFSLNFEKKITRRFSATAMANGILTYDYQELGFAFYDGGLKYKITRNFSTNANYRFMQRRNLDNFYDDRHLIYADIDFSKGFKRFTVGGTSRFQKEYYSRFIDSYRFPLAYNRSRVNLKYRANYYWQPFAEIEVFTPLNHPVRKKVDQLRFSLGFHYTFNENVNVEFFAQIRQQINRAPRNTIFLTAINWYFRF